ncbi:30S ribosomal protein S8 [Candidatus Riesia sp. GBBU]|nr:30S ribosomal protein S8 [Candidatus Riesia sp. GBBU]
MNIQDPVSDMITRIRNAQKANKEFVSVPFSNLKVSISSVLKEEGYIKNFSINREKKNISYIIIQLKYFNGNGVIENIKRISKPGLRIYKKKDQIPLIMEGLGIVIISTSQGVMTDRKARKNRLGGEVICYVS